MQSFDLIFPKVRNHIIESSVNEFLPLNFSVTNIICTSGAVNSLGNSDRPISLLKRIM